MIGRRGFFKGLGAATLSALLPLGALAALDRKKPQFADVTFSSDDRYLSFDDFHKRILEPALRRIADQVDEQMMGLVP
jgi:hypothetical protein